MKQKNLKKLVLANWKLNPMTLAEALKLGKKISAKPIHETVICPPHPFLSHKIYSKMGAQDAFWQGSGPYTGQVSPVMLKNFKMKYCLVGHSERRTLGESEADVKKKIEALLSVSIVPVLCIGFGTTVEQEDLEVINVLKGQLKSALAGLSEEQLSKVVVAYEPVWAISSGNPYATKKLATPEHASKIALFIKTKFKIKKVLYGGSVNATNAAGFLSENQIDGLLVGGASLIASDFNQIINAKV